jgi:hypothetical protein
VERRGQRHLDDGPRRLAWKSFTHADKLVQVIEVQATGGEQNYTFS